MFMLSCYSIHESNDLFSMQIIFYLTHFFGSSINTSEKNRIRYLSVFLDCAIYSFFWRRRRSEAEENMEIPTSFSQSLVIRKINFPYNVVVPLGWSATRKGWENICFSFRHFLYILLWPIHYKNIIMLMIVLIKVTRNFFLHMIDFSGYKRSVEQFKIFSSQSSSSENIKKWVFIQSLRSLCSILVIKGFFFWVFFAIILFIWSKHVQNCIWLNFVSLSAVHKHIWSFKQSVLFV